MAYETTPTTTAWPSDLGWGMGAVGGVGLDWRNRALGLLNEYEDLKFRALFIRNYQAAETLIRNLGPASSDGTPENRSNHVRHNVAETEAFVDDLKGEPLNTALDSYYLSKGYRTGRIRDFENQVAKFKGRVTAAESSNGMDKVAKISKSPFEGVRIRRLEGARSLPADRTTIKTTPRGSMWSRPGTLALAALGAVVVGLGLRKLAK